MLLGVGALVILWVVWVESPLLSFVLICLAATAKDFRSGRRLARSMPDKDGGRICARFAYAWGAFKFGITAFVLMMCVVFWFASATEKERDEAVVAVSSLPLLGIAGFILSAVLTATSLVAAYRSGMRVWIGEGVNQARTLFMAMLIVIFFLVVLVPTCIWMGGRVQPPAQEKPIIPALVMLFVSMFAGPIVILLTLDWISRRVLADRPGKFGPKVPTVGKWNG
jgi:hypothetical protein